MLISYYLWKSYTVVTALKSVTLYDASKCQSYIMLKDITLHNAGKYQPCTVLESIILHNIRSQSHTILKGVNFALSIKKLYVYMLEDINLIPLMKTMSRWC